MDIKEFVKDRNEALLSLDKDKILFFTKKYSMESPIEEPAFWGGVHKAILHINSATDEQKEISRQWLVENGFSTEIRFC